MGRLLRHAASVLQYALRQQPAVGRSDYDLPIRLAVSPIRIRDIAGGNPFPGVEHQDGRRSRSRPFGVYVNTPLHTQPTALQQWNVSVQRQVGDWLASASYLGNHSSHLWRATELNPAVFGPGATTGNANARRVLSLANPSQGQFYGTIGQLDDTGRANYAAVLFSLQRRLKNNLSVLSSWTISKCMSDPATTEITGPTIVNPAHPDADYAYCSSDRRHLLSFSVVARTPEFANPTLRAILRDWQFSPAGPLSKRQPLERDDWRRQRAHRTGRPAGGANPRRPVRPWQRSLGVPKSVGLHVADRPAPTAIWRRSRS